MSELCKYCGGSGKTVKPGSGSWNYYGTNGVTVPSETCRICHGTGLMP